MEVSFESVALLLLVATVVAIITHRLHIPYCTGLVAAGIGLALLPFAPKVHLTKELLFTALLPPLIFEAAYQLDWAQLRRDLAVLLALSTLGVVLSATVTAVGMHYLAGWDWLSCAAFGALIAATDPVSVIATFREARVQGRLLVLVESESLFNDGTAAVAFSVVMLFAFGNTPSFGETLFTLAKMVAGGILVGAVGGLGVLLLAGRTEDHLVEIACTMVAAYASFLVAERFHVSGVLATLTAGLVMANHPVGGISKHGQEAVGAFWEYAAFMSNSLIFLLIGMSGAHVNLLAVWTSAVAAILLVILGRAAAIYPTCLLFLGSSRRVSLRHQSVLFWGGLRGALGLTLALALPSEIPMRGTIVTISFAVVAFSIFVQGLTMTPLLRATGEVPRVA